MTNVNLRNIEKKVIIQILVWCLYCLHLYLVKIEFQTNKTWHFGSQIQNVYPNLNDYHMISPGSYIIGFHFSAHLDCSLLFHPMYSYLFYWRVGSNQSMTAFDYHSVKKVCLHSTRIFYLIVQLS